MSNIKEIIESGKAFLGIEFGSTRIKAVLIDEEHNPIASGSHTWENRYENGLWTYSLDDIWTGLQDSYRDMAENVQKEYGVTIKKLGAIGFSAMMHGYMAFDKEGKLLAPFQTWRNSNTPSQWYVVPEQIYQHFRSLSCIAVSPCLEWCKKLSLFVKCHDARIYGI